MELHLLNSPLWILLCIALGAAYAFALYRQPSPFSPPVRRTLMLLRFLSVGFLAFFLLRPSLTYTAKITDPPIVLILLDDSQSMVQGADSTQVKALLNKAFPEWKTQTKTGYRILPFAFSDLVNPSPESLNFAGKGSNLNLALEQIQTQFANQRVAAGLLISDGIFNQGSNPVFSAAKSPFPWFAMATGDTTTLADAAILEMQANPIAFLGNRFPIRIRFSIERMPQSAFKLILRNRKGQELQSLNIAAPLPRQSSEHVFLVEAAALGMQTFKAELLPLTGDKVPANNQASVSVEVLDDRKNIALIAAAPHPDISAIVQAAAGSEDLQLSSYLLRDLPGNLTEFDAAILHGLTAQSSVPPSLKTELDKGLAYWWISGSEHSSSLFNALNPGINCGFSANNDLTFAVPSSAFTLFQTPPDWTPSQWPPLLSPFGTYQVQPGSTVFQFKKIGAVATQQPLWVFREANGRRSSVLMGEGIWKWRMSAFKESNSPRAFDETIGMLLQWLSLKEERKRFMVKTRKRHAEGSNVLLQAEVLDAALQPMREAKITLNLTNEQGQRFSYPFQPGNAGYTLQISGLKSGSYDYEAKVESQADLPLERGSFVVEKTALEGLQRQANHQTIKDIALGSGGRALPIGDFQAFESILKDLEVPSIARSITDQFPLWESLWPLLLLILLLIGEWALRKFQGRI